jgi:hypothetical protein
VSDSRLPRIGAPEGKESSLDPSDFIVGHLPDYANLLGGFGSAVMRQIALGPTTLEVARLRNAHRMQCRLCMNLRRQSAVESGLVEGLVERLAADDMSELSVLDRTVVDLVDAYLTSPGALCPALIERVRAELTLEQLAHLLTSLVIWTGNRVLVALAIDSPMETDRTTMFEYSPSGVQSYFRTIQEGNNDE